MDETEDVVAEEAPTYERAWTVRFADTDPFGIAHYPRIVDAIHHTADEYVESIGYPFWRLTGEEGVGLPIVDVGAQFHRPLEAGDVVTIELTPQLGESSVRFEYDATIEGQPAFTAYEQRVCVEVGGDEGIAVPGWLRDAMGSDD